MKQIFLSVLTFCAVGAFGGCGGSSSASSNSNALPPGTTSFLVTAPNAPTNYSINSVANASLTLQRGMTYTFNVNAPGHPFYIMSVKGTDISNAYGVGVSGNGATGGSLIFTVPTSAPNNLYYNCSNHLPMGGAISIIN